MKRLTRFLTGSVILFFLCSAALQAAEGWTTFKARPGPDSNVTIEGTSTVHDWRVVSKVIQGTVETGPGFPADPASAKPGKVEAKASVAIIVRTLKSVKEDGKPYDDKMDEIMYEKLKMSEQPRITFTLTEMALKAAPKDAEAPFVFDSKGKLTVAKVTKEVAMPIEMKVLDAKRRLFSGKVDLKMTDFGIEPPAPALAMGLIKTGDAIKLSFDWLVTQR